MKLKGTLNKSQGVEGSALWKKRVTGRPETRLRLWRQDRHKGLDSGPQTKGKKTGTHVKAMPLEEVKLRLSVMTENWIWSIHDVLRGFWPRKSSWEWAWSLGTVLVKQFKVVIFVMVGFYLNSIFSEGFKMWKSFSRVQDLCLADHSHWQQKHKPRKSCYNIHEH